MPSTGSSTMEVTMDICVVRTARCSFSIVTHGYLPRAALAPLLSEDASIDRTLPPPVPPRHDKTAVHDATLQSSENYDQPRDEVPPVPSERIYFNQVLDVTDEPPSIQPTESKRVGNDGHRYTSRSFSFRSTWRCTTSNVRSTAFSRCTSVNKSKCFVASTTTAMPNGGTWRSSTIVNSAATFRPITSNWPSSALACHLSN